MCECMCCVALPCCLFDLACFFLPSFSSLIKHRLHSLDYIPLLLVKVPKDYILPIGLLEFHPVDFKVNSSLIHIIIYTYIFA